MKKAFAAIFLLFLAACTGTQASYPSTGTPSIEAYSLFSETPTILLIATITSTPIPERPGPPTATPLPSATPRVNLPLKSGKGIILTSIQMFDPQSGWGFDSDYHILRTRNAGRTWQDVTPPTGHYSRAGFFALDPDTAWATFTIGLYSNPKTAYVWRTGDGGETWTASKEFRLDFDQDGEPYPSEFFLPVTMQFIDPQTGWLLAHVAYDMNAARPLFFHTDDGGETWTTINSHHDFPEACIGVGFIFIDSHTGWIGGNCFYQGVVYIPMKSLFPTDGWRVNKTMDGGLSYESNTELSLPAEFQQPDFLAGEGNCGEIRFLYVSPNVFGIEWGCHGFVQVGPDYRFFALSADGGQNWNSWKSSGNEEFIDGIRGWRLLSPGALQETTDGSLNWMTIKNVTWDDAQFDFVSEQQGWAIVASGHATAFLRTDDGGQTWAELNPIIGP